MNGKMLLGGGERSARCGGCGHGRAVNGNDEVASGRDTLHLQAAQPVLCDRVHRGDDGHLEGLAGAQRHIELGQRCAGDRKCVRLSPQQIEAYLGAGALCQ